MIDTTLAVVYSLKGFYTVITSFYAINRILCTRIINMSRTMTITAPRYYSVRGVQPLLEKLRKRVLTEFVDCITST